MEKTDKFQQKLVWNEIAKKWKEYRCEPLPEVKDFLRSKTGKVLDLCCGSGRNFIKINGIFYGVDFSEEMIKYARDRAGTLNIEAIIAKSEADVLPFEDNFFDAAIFVSALQCITSREEREAALKELFRVLKNGSQALISVWNKEQKRFANKEKETFISWKIDGKEQRRYYYLYDQKEIVDLLRLMGFEILQIIERVKDLPQKSIIVIVRKPWHTES